jgi:Putative metallopeptidase
MIRPTTTAGGRVLPRFRCSYLLSALLAVCALAVAPASAQPTAAEFDSYRARIDAAVKAVGDHPRFRTLSLKKREQIAEFVSGNLLFTLLHELGHAAINQFNLPVLGREEDAADSFAATRLIRVGSSFSDQVVAGAAQSWFLMDRRDRKEGDTVPYYDEHGPDQQRAYQIVCFVVGSNASKFKKLADETKLPDDRRDSCADDFRTAAKSWDALLDAHRRAPDQPPTEVKVVYGEAEGRLALTAEISRAINLLENVAHYTSNRLAWPAPFTLEMRTCGSPNAAWVPSELKLTLCYELGPDLADLYRTFGDAQPKTAAKENQGRLKCAAGIVTPAQRTLQACRRSNPSAPGKKHR